MPASDTSLPATCTRLRLATATHVVGLHVWPFTDAVCPLERDMARPVVIQHHPTVTASHFAEGAAIAYPPAFSTARQSLLTASVRQAGWMRTEAICRVIQGWRVPASQARPD